MLSPGEEEGGDWNCERELTFLCMNRRDKERTMYLKQYIFVLVLPLQVFITTNRTEITGFVLLSLESHRFNS